MVNTQPNVQDPSGSGAVSSASTQLDNLSIWCTRLSRPKYDFEVVDSPFAPCKGQKKFVGRLYDGEIADVIKNDPSYAGIIKKVLQATLDITPLHYAIIRKCYESIDLLIQDGVNTEATDVRGGTALHYAAFMREPMLVDFLLDRGANINAKTKEGYSPLFYAIQSRCAETVELLVKRGAILNEFIICDRDLNKHCSYLHSAIETKDLAVVETLLRCNADVNVRDSWRSTALHYASSMGLTDVAALLLSYGARINEMDYQKESPLSLCMKRGHNDLFQLLLDNGADLDECGSAEFSILHVAAGQEGQEFMQILPSNVNSKDEQGKTPLHFASQYSRKEIYDALLHYNADVNCRDNRLETPLHAAVKEGCPSTVHCLLQCGADINAQDEMLLTPFHEVIRYDRVHLFVLMMTYKPDLEAADIEGYTPLHWAVMQEYWKVDCVNRVKFTFFDILLILGARVNVKSYETGETPLHLAVKYDSEIFTKQLLQYGAEVDPEESLQHRTPLHIAVENGYGKCIQHLLTFGADPMKVDKDGKTPMDLTSCEWILQIIARHLIKGSMARLIKNPKKLKIAEEAVEPEFKTQCAEELQRMSVTKMYDDVTYCDFLRGTKRSLAHFVTRKEVIHIFNHDRHTMFPIYADILHRNWDIGTTYKDVMEPATERLNAILKYEMPSLPLEKIFNYLNVTDMKILVETIPSLPITFIKKEESSTL